MQLGVCWASGVGGYISFISFMKFLLINKYFFYPFICLFSFWDSYYMHIRSYDIVIQSLGSLPRPRLFHSLCFNLDTFFYQLTYLQVHWSFPLLCPVSCYDYVMNFFISDILFSNFLHFHFTLFHGSMSLPKLPSSSCTLSTFYRLVCYYFYHSYFKGCV